MSALSNPAPEAPSMDSERVYDHYLRCRNYMKVNKVGPRDMFMRIDTTGCRHVGARALRVGLQFLYKGIPGGCHVPLEEAVDIIRSMDNGGADTMVMEHFESWCAAHEAKWRQRFQLGRYAEDGFIRLFTEMGKQGLTAEELYDEFDQDDGDEIDRDEFADGLDTHFGGTTFKEEERGRMFDAIDYDRNDFISRDEWTTRLEFNVRQAIEMAGTAEMIEAMNKYGLESERTLRVVHGKETTTARTRELLDRRGTTAKTSGTKALGLAHDGDDVVRQGGSAAAATQAAAGRTARARASSYSKKVGAGRARRRQQGGGAAGGEQVGEWRKVVDKSSGKPYWYNKLTRETRWNMPEDALKPGAAIVSVQTREQKSYALSDHLGYSNPIPRASDEAAFDPKNSKVRSVRSGTYWGSYDPSKGGSGVAGESKRASGEESEERERVYGYYLRVRACMRDKKIDARALFKRIDASGHKLVGAVALRRGLTFLYKDVRSITSKPPGCSVSMREADSIVYSMSMVAEEGSTQPKIDIDDFDDWCHGHEAEWNRRFLRVRDAEDVFFHLWVEMAKTEVTAEELFNEFDQSKNGLINQEEMTLGLKRYFGHAYNAQEAQLIFDAIDYDGNGDITRVEWRERFVATVEHAVEQNGTPAQIAALHKHGVDGKRTTLLAKGEQKSERTKQLTCRRVSISSALPPTLPNAPDVIAAVDMLYSASATPLPEAGAETGAGAGAGARGGGRSDDWVKVVDKSSGRTYWYDPKSKATSWTEPPLDVSVPSRAGSGRGSPVGGGAARGGVSREDPEHVFELYLRLRDYMKLRKAGARDVFRSIDHRGRRHVDAATLRMGLQFLYKGMPGGCHVLVEDAEDIIRSLDNEETQEVDTMVMEEFEQWCGEQELKWRSRFALGRSAEDVWVKLYTETGKLALTVDELYNEFDQDDGDEIDRVEMREGLARVFGGGMFSEDHAMLLFDAIDYDHNDFISRDEWHKRFDFNVRQAIEMTGTAEQIEAMNKYGLESTKTIRIVDAKESTSARTRELTDRRGRSAKAAAAKKAALKKERLAAKVVAALPGKKGLPLNWKKTMDQSSGKPYWYNKVTRETRWSMPVEPLTVKTNLASSSPMSFGGGVAPLPPQTPPPANASYTLSDHLGYSNPIPRASDEAAFDPKNSKLQSVRRGTYWGSYDPTDVQILEEGAEAGRSDPLRVYDAYLRVRAYMRMMKVGPRDVFHACNKAGHRRIGPVQLRRGLTSLFKDVRSITSKTGCKVPPREAEEIVLSINEGLRKHGLFARSGRRGSVGGLVGEAAAVWSHASASSDQNLDEDLGDEEDLSIDVAGFQAWCDVHELTWRARDVQARQAHPMIYEIFKDLLRLGITSGDLYGQFDIDGNNFITAMEMHLGLGRMMQHPPTSEEVDEFFRVLDVDGNGGIDRSEWVSRYDEHAEQAVCTLGTKTEVKEVRDMLKGSRHDTGSRVIKSTMSDPKWQALHGAPRIRQCTEKGYGTGAGGGNSGAGLARGLEAHSKRHAQRGGGGAFVVVTSPKSGAKMADTQATKNLGRNDDEVEAYRRYIMLHREVSMG